VWIRQQVVFTDFIVLDGNLDMTLILGRPFLRSVKVQINIWAETIRFNVNAQRMLSKFQPQDTPCVFGYNLPLTRKQRKHHNRKLNEYISPVIEVPGCQNDGWKDRWGTPTIQCSILNLSIKEALCDLGAEVNIMPLAIYKKLEWFLPLSPIDVQIQLADATV
jgi:hypothetical protein